MGSPSPHLRAAGVSILAALVGPAPALVVSTLPRLVELRHDAWWQVAVANVSVAAGMLWHLREYVTPGDAPTDASERAAAAIGSAEQILLGVMGAGRGASAATTRMFVSRTARLLPFFPALRGPFLDAVLALAPDAREALLGVSAAGEFVGAGGGEDVLPLLGPSGQRIAVPAVGGALPAATVVAMVCEAVLAADLQHLELAHLQLLLAAALSAELDAATGHLPPAFAALANALRDHIFVGLCDALCCPAALALLALLVTRLPAGGGGGIDLLAAPTLQGSLMLLHAPPSGAPEPALQADVANFLRDAGAISPEAAAAVRDLLAAWASRYPALFADSPLRAVAEELA